MRIRQVKPEFFRDSTIAELSPVVRLTYIGLWLLSDDAGWFRLDVPAIALELYGWDLRPRREKVVANAVADLVANGRVVTFECVHAFIPTFTAHQRFSVAAKRVYTFRKEHELHTPAGSPPTPAGDSDPTHIPPPGIGKVEVRERGNGKERNGTSNARKRDDESESEFRARAGLPAFMGGES